MNEEVIFTTEDVKKNKGFGILSYFGILVLIPIFAAKDSLYARFHANQGLVLLIAEFILNIIGRIVRFALKVGTFGLVNNVVDGVVGLAISALSLTYLIIGIINACSGEAKKLPIIGEITLLK